MKKLVYLLLFSCSVSFASTQLNNDYNNNDPEVGDILKISTPKNLPFKHIDFPRLNFIAKRG